MSSRLISLAAVAALTACSSFQYGDPSPVTTPEPAAIDGVVIPDSPPLREPFTTYLKVTRDGVTVGYMVRFDPLPEGSDIDADGREGTLLVENSRFERIGFITRLGKGYLHEGADSKEVGQGTLEKLLPAFFGERGTLEVSPLR
ncbi:MAG: hypothetical protein V2A76_06595 [Planctomycetota bacterium]